MSTPSPPLYHQRFDPRLFPQRSPLQRLLHLPSSQSRAALERAGVPRSLAIRALRRMRTEHAAHAYAAALGEYAQHAGGIAWITRSAAVTEYQALCALRAYPDPAEARDHVLHQTHRAAWAGCRFCEREAQDAADADAGADAERARRRTSALSAASGAGSASAVRAMSGLRPAAAGRAGRGAGPNAGTGADAGADGVEELDVADMGFPPPCPPAVGVTPATPVSVSRPLTPASRSSPALLPAPAHPPAYPPAAASASAPRSRSDAGHGSTLRRSQSWTIRVQTLTRRSSAEAPPGAFNVVGVRYAPSAPDTGRTLPQHPAKKVQTLRLQNSIGYLPGDMRPLA